MKQRNISFWVKSLEAINSPLLSLQGESSLPEKQKFDIAIIGGGLTGLWLAYYLQIEKPHYQIAIFEKEQIGYGASGRNGGWLSREVPIEADALLKKPGVTQTHITQFYRMMREAIMEVENVCLKEDIACDLLHGGVLTIATNTAQVERLKEFHQDQQAYLLTKEAAQQRINIPSIQGAHYDEIGARIHPPKTPPRTQKSFIKKRH